MRRRFQNRAVYLLERLFSRGPWAQFLILALLIAGISLVGGVSAHLLSPGQFTVPTGVWWAFLRLTDPGYLGDDEGAAVRTLSTVLTVTGYVVFLGAFVAILTQWLMRTLRRLEAGTTPYAGREHIVVLGVTNRTPVILAQLLGADRSVQRFLRRHGTSRLRIAVLADDAARATIDLKSQIGELWSTRTVVVRSGSPLRSDHLARIDPTNASAIIVPSGDYSGATAELADTVTVKALLSLDKAAALDPESPPLVIAEIKDVRNSTVARASYRGPLELIAGDRIMGRIIAQSIRHRGMGAVFSELLAHNEGSEVYVRPVRPNEEGTIESVAARIPGGIVVGVIRNGTNDARPFLNPPTDLEVDADDRLVILARSSDDIESRRAATLPPVRRLERRGLAGKLAETRVLILGWNRRVPALIDELAGHRNEEFRITVASRVSTDHRSKLIAALSRTDPPPSCEQIDSDYTLPGELDDLRPAGYDVVLLVASDWLETGEHADARTITGALLIRQVVAVPRPLVIMELSRAENASLIPPGLGEVIITPRILSYVLTQVALRHELSRVFDELFAAGGTEIAFVDSSTYGLPPSTFDFGELERRVAERGHTAIGYRRADGRVVLNPSRAEPVQTRTIVSIVSNGP